VVSVNKGSVVRRMASATTHDLSGAAWRQRVGMQAIAARGICDRRSYAPNAEIEKGGAYLVCLLSTVPSYGMHELREDVH
jgi:hypothetical protein